MGVTLKTKPDVIRAYAQKKVDEMKEKIIRRFSYVGQLCVEDARLRGSYTDRTGNLRGSIGYVVADDGVIVDSSAFTPVKGGTKGPTAGRSFAESLVRGRRGLVLVIVAGMRYAAYVADRGYNVLDSAEIIAERLLSQLTTE